MKEVVKTMKLTVDKEKCIGCGACVGTCSDVFEFGDDGLAKVRVEEVEEEEKECSLTALEGCPTSAIREIEE
jgi:ferredoxin